MGEKNIIFNWQQVLPEPNDLAGWKLYMSEVSAGPYTLWDTIVFVSVQTDYSATRVFSSPEGEKKTYYFVLSAFDVDGNESVYSNEANVTIDFLAPLAPYSLTVKLQVI